MTDFAASRRADIERNGFALSSTQGRSMRPLIWGGRHCVAVAPLDGEPAIGDLLMFRHRACGESRSIVHRLVAVEDRGGERVYITRGDNSLGTETIVSADIIGRVAEVHRLTGWRPWYAIPRRKFTVNDRAYRLYTRVWTVTWPVRRLAYRLRAALSRLA